MMPAALAFQTLGSLLAAKYLGPADTSVFRVLFATMAVLNLVTEMGTGTILMKLVADGAKTPGHYISITLPFLGLLCTLGGVVQFIIVWSVYAEPYIRMAGLLSSLNTVIFGASLAISCTMRGMGDVWRWLLGFFGHKVAFVVLLVGGMWVIGRDPTLHPWRLSVAVGSWTGAGVLNFLYSGWCVWGETWRGQLRWRVNEIIELWKESLPIGLNSAANQLGQYLDSFVVSGMVSRETAGNYLLAQGLLNPVRNILHGAVSTPTFPGLCRLVNEDRKEFDRQSLRLCVLQWLCGLPLALMVWVAAPPLVPKFLPKFIPSLPIFAITVWALAPGSLSLQLRYTYTALNRQKIYLLYNVIFLIVKCIALIIGTWQWGIVGAAIATVSSELFFAAIGLLGCTKLPAIGQLLWRVGIASAITGAVAGLYAFLAHQGWQIAAYAVAVLFLFGSGLFLNRMLRSVRSHLPKKTPGEPVAAAAAEA